MSPSHRRATAQNFTEFAQNLEVCTHILKTHALLPVLQNICVFLQLYVSFWVYFKGFFAFFLI